MTGRLPNNPISNALALVDFETRESKKEEIAKFLEDLVISLHDLFFVVQHSMTERRKRNLDRANKVKKGVNFVLGDLVYVRNDVANEDTGDSKLDPIWQGPAVVVKVNDDGLTYEIQMEMESKILHRHAKFLKRFKGNYTNVIVDKKKFRLKQDIVEVITVAGLDKIKSHWSIKLTYLDRKGDVVTFEAPIYKVAKQIPKDMLRKCLLESGSIPN